MSVTQEYPLLENLEIVRQQKFKTLEEKLDAIIFVMDEEALSLSDEKEDDSCLPNSMRRAAKFKWGLASCVFAKDKELLHLMNIRQTLDSVERYYLLCINEDMFYDMAVMYFYNFYSDQSGNGLTHDETTKIIQSVFGEHFSKLDEAFRSFLVKHVSKLIVQPKGWDESTKADFTLRESKHYRTTYGDCFFAKYIEEAISSVSL